MWAVFGLLKIVEYVVITILFTTRRLGDYNKKVRRLMVHLTV